MSGDRSKARWLHSKHRLMERYGVVTWEGATKAMWFCIKAVNSGKAERISYAGSSHTLYHVEHPTLGTLRFLWDQVEIVTFLTPFMSRQISSTRRSKKCARDERLKKNMTKSQRARYRRLKEKAESERENYD